MKDEEKQQKMMELQILNQQSEQLRQQLVNLEEQMENLKNLERSLEVLEKEEIGREIYSPLSSGVFMKTSLKDNKEVLNAVGAGVIVKKSVKDARDMLKDQEKKMELVLMQVKDEFEKFEERYLLARGMGILIVSTKWGIVTHNEAKKKNIGGKLLAYCY